MKILCKNTQIPMAASTQVNRIGKYLYRHLDGAYAFKQGANTFDVFVTLLYQLKPEYQNPTNGEKYNDVHEMSIDINISTYSNDVRVNTVEMTPEERTLGYDLIPADDLDDLEQAKKLILWKVGNRIRKNYKEFIILF